MSDDYNIEVPEGSAISKLQIEAADGSDSIKNAEELTLTFTGKAPIVAAAFEGLIQFLTIAFDAEIAGMVGPDGETIPLPSPAMLDALDLGDDPELQ